MAYSLPSLNAAGNYLASYRQVQPVDGFEDVLSKDAFNTIARQQELAFAAKVGMAKQALNNLTQKMINEDKIKYYEGRDDKDLKIGKMTALGGLMGGGGSSRSSAGSSSLLSPLDQQIALNTKTDAINNRVDKTQRLEDAFAEAGIDAVFESMFGEGRTKTQPKAAPKAPAEELQFKSTTSVADQLKSALESEIQRRQSGQ